MPDPLPPPTSPEEGSGRRVRALFGRGRLRDTWTELEELLIQADVGPRGAADLVQRVAARSQPGTDPAALLRDEIIAVLGSDEELAPGEGPARRDARRRA